ncbi:hypothetical protein PS15p_204655 [Mucor circinelloides]
MSMLSLQEDQKKVATIETTETVSSSISTTSIDPNEPDKGLKRTLKSRHLTMISIGGVVGQGLFLSSGANLAKAGPAGLLVAYFIIGYIVFWIAVELGEMAAYIPISGSFTVYCRRFVDKSFGTVIGYNYWACWSIIVAVELTGMPAERSLTSQLH